MSVFIKWLSCLLLVSGASSALATWSTAIVESTDFQWITISRNMVTLSSTVDRSTLDSSRLKNTSGAIDIFSSVDIHNDLQTSDQRMTHHLHFRFVSLSFIDPDTLKNVLEQLGISENERKRLTSDYDRYLDFYSRPLAALRLQEAEDYLRDAEDRPASTNSLRVNNEVNTRGSNRNVLPTPPPLQMQWNPHVLPYIFTLLWVAIIAKLNPQQNKRHP